MAPIPKRPARRRINVSLSNEAWRRLQRYTTQRNLELPYQLSRSAVIEDLLLQLPDGQTDYDPNRPLDIGDGHTEQKESVWKAVDRPCRSRGCAARVECRVWTDDDGHEDVKFRCDNGHQWAVEGADA